MARGLILVALAALSGCSLLPAKPERIEVPIPVPCVSGVPMRPALMTDSEIRALDDYRATLATWRDRRIAIDHIATLEATLRACAAK